MKKVTRDMYKELKDDDIQWIVTVPAIWNDTAKNKMRQWIISAGLVNKNINDQCKIVYEPDCASLAIQYELNKMRINQISSPTDDDDEKYFNKNEKYILVDAGGGTVDIACHEILSENNMFGVKEVLHPSGGAWGSYYIDEQFIELLQDIFGKKLIDAFKIEKANEYTELLHNFQNQKHEFYKIPEAKTHNIELGMEFVTYIQDILEEKDDGIEIEDMVKQCTAFENHNDNRLEDTMLVLSSNIWKSMFNHVIDPTISHIKNLLDKAQLMGGCKYLCLVGGLSISPYFRARMDQEFGPKSRYKLKLIKPKRPLLCVVEGAAYMGLTENYIKARILKYSYGELLSLPEWYAIEKGMPDHHREQHRYYNEDKKEMWVSDCFDIIVSKYEEIWTGQIKFSKSKRKNLHILKSTKTILCSDMEDPKVEWDGIEIGKVVTRFDDDKNDLEMTLEFHFYDTLIMVISYRDKEPNKRERHYIINELYQ